jgi:hypothetical protein
MYDKNRSLAIFIIAVLVILVCGGTGFMSYSQGKDTGYNNGYNAAQEYSYSQGYNKGKDEGYKIGYDAGFEAAYNPKPVESTDSYTLQNPTYQEMKDFLSKDTADSKTYIEGKYTCTDFAAEVNNNAEDQGIRCAVVYIVYPDTGHSIVAFETTDKGLIFIEPQYDKEVTLTIGKSYSKLNGYLQQEPVDDTIQRYQIMW